MRVSPPEILGCVRMTNTHFVRLDFETFRAVTEGRQNAIVVASVEAIAVGDQLVFREWRATPTRRGGGEFTGLWVMRRVTHNLVGSPGIASGFVVVSLNTAADNEWATSQMRRKLSLAERSGLSPERFWRAEERKAGAQRGTLRLPVDGLEAEDQTA